MPKIYTRTGDKGETSLWDGTRVPKDHPLMKINGLLDEAFSLLGAARSVAPKVLREEIFCLQTLIMDIMTFVARGKKEYSLPDAKSLEVKIDLYQDKYPLNLYSVLSKRGKFIVPGESLGESLLHVARSIVRAAEREAVSAVREGFLDERILPLLNRLSDFLYILAVACIFEEFVERLVKVLYRELTSLWKEEGGGIMTRNTGKELNLEDALVILEAAKKKAREINVPMVIAVVDEAGMLVAFNRMDGALPISCDLAVKKAKTAALIRMPTHEVADLVQPGKPLYGLQSDPDLCCFGGGFPLKRNGIVVGGIGVSGGTVEQDIEVAKAALEVFK
ncbi:MAG: hypothetical protein PWQ16_16 [bacterium]|nr:MAG: ATP/cobalamin adenosyltransferase [bacterium 42_11]MDK2870665.1 hypothetical protein [bacterium]